MTRFTNKVIPVIGGGGIGLAAAQYLWGHEGSVAPSNSPGHRPT
jgi:hypothetical protein